jgi:predicted RNA-binding protein with PUA-like domain
MGHWLVKSDPGEYGWENLVADGETDWTGIRNNAARLHLLGMKKGDPVLFYHSGGGMAVVGQAAVTREAFRDPTAGEDRWVAVGLRPVRAFGKPVPLAKIKSEEKLKQTPLVRIGRLSVMPLTKPEFDCMVKLGR